jgi:hypothetical protein
LQKNPDRLALESHGNLRIEERYTNESSKELQKNLVKFPVNLAY